MGLNGMVRISEKAKEAAEQARQEVINNAQKPKEKGKRTASNEESKQDRGTWIKDIWGIQGELFKYEGKYFVITRLLVEEGRWQVITLPVDPQEYEKHPERYNYGIAKRSMERRRDTGVTGNKSKPVKTPSKGRGTSRNMARKKKGVFDRDANNLAKGKRKSGKKVGMEKER